jgi:hypothetical protein
MTDTKGVDRAIAGSDLRRLAFRVQHIWEPTRATSYLTDMERHQLCELTRGLFLVSAALLPSDAPMSMAKERTLRHLVEASVAKAEAEARLRGEG